MSRFNVNYVIQIDCRLPLNSWQTIQYQNYTQQLTQMQIILIKIYNKALVCID
jgi:hypothetical protein